MSTSSTTASAVRYLSPASETRTALLLIDIQRGLNTHNGYCGSERSTPAFEENITSLLAACRGYNSNSRTTKPQGPSAPSSLSPASDATTNDPSEQPHAIEIVHVYHKSTNPLSPLHASGTTQKDGILFMPCAEPAGEERVLSKSTNTAFGNPELKTILETARLEQLIVAGIATDHCVTTSVRWAKDLGVVKKKPVLRGGQNGDTAEHLDGGDQGDSAGKKGDQGKIVILSDATACFNKGGFDAETVQKVHLASLEGEFAKVMTTKDVLDQLLG